jgi:hypothetical protein
MPTVTAGFLVTLAMSAVDQAHWPVRYSNLEMDS